MNIVKLKDIILTTENAPDLTDEQRDLFNTKFRGRYVHCINWSYLVPLEDMTGNQAVDVSRMLTGFAPIFEPWLGFKEFTSEETREILEAGYEYL